MYSQTSLAGSRVSVDLLSLLMDPIWKPPLRH